MLGNQCLAPHHFCTTLLPSRLSRSMSFERSKTACSKFWSNVMASCGQALTHNWQKMHEPKSYSYAARIFLDRKSTRLNSSHANISYAVFCLKKKKKS